MIKRWLERRAEAAEALLNAPQVMLIGKCTVGDEPEESETRKCTATITPRGMWVMETYVDAELLPGGDVGANDQAARVWTRWEPLNDEANKYFETKFT